MIRDFRASLDYRPLTTADVVSRDRKFLSSSVIFFSYNQTFANNVKILSLFLCLDRRAQDMRLCPKTPAEQKG